MFVYILLASCFTNALTVTRIDFLDTESVIVKRSPTPGQVGLFGYSAVLHNVNVTGDISGIRYAACRISYCMH